MKDIFYSQDKDLVLKKLNTDADKGLSNDEVLKRKQNKFRPNYDKLF